MPVRRRNMRDYQLRKMISGGWISIADVPTVHLKDMLTRSRDAAAGSLTTAHNECTVADIITRIEIELLARNLGLATGPVFSG